MSGRFPDGFDGARRSVADTSDQALYEFLRVHILGPYVNDGHLFLSEVKFRLQDAGFERAKLCSDRDDKPPARLQKDSLSEEEEQELKEFWTETSYSFLEHADVAIFFFLDPALNRADLSPDAFRDIGESERDHGYSPYDVPQDSNGSVVEELNYWQRKMEIAPERTLVLFEESNYAETGSLVAGRVGLEGVHWNTFETNDLDAVERKTRSRCMNWAMNECKPRLQDQYYNQQR